MSEKKIVRYRSSVTGRWAPKAVAQRNSPTHEREEYDVPADKDSAMESIRFVVEGIREAQPEDMAEWVLEGQEILQTIRAEAMAAFD